MKKLLILLMLVVCFNIYPDTYKDVLKDITDIIETNKKELDLEEKNPNVCIGFYPLGFVTQSFIFEVEKPMSELSTIILKFGSYDLDESTNKYEVKYRQYARSKFRGTYVSFFGGYCTIEGNKYDKEDPYYSDYSFEDGPYIGMELGYKRKFIERIYMSNGINFGYKHGSGPFFPESREMFFGLDLFKISINF